MDHVVRKFGWIIASVGLVLSRPVAVRTETPPASGTLRVDVTDEQDHPLPCRVHLYDAKGKPHFAPDLPHWADHFVCPGQAQMDLPPGQYRYEIERGPEYLRLQGNVMVEAGKQARVVTKLSRLANLASQGWWSGDLHIHRPLKDIELLMRAEDLYVGPVITWWNDHNSWQTAPLPEPALRRCDGDRWIHPLAGEDEREGGALLYFNLTRPLELRGSQPEYPSPLRFVEQARRQVGAWIDIEKPFWWDVPVWVASGQIDSIGLANNHMARSEMFESEA